MNPIDLSQCAEYSQKIPTEYLSTKLSSEVPLKKAEIISTHVLDSVVIFQVFVWFRALLEVSVGKLMMGDLMSDAFATTGGFIMNAVLLSIIAWTYFTCAYFFNQGQTAGMKLMKRRISMSELSFDSAFRWSLYSLSLYVTCGLTLSFVHAQLKEQGHGSFTGHDHLYEELMAYKAWAAPALIESTELQSTTHEHYEEAA